MKKTKNKLKKNKISIILDKIKKLSKITSENESEKQSESECISKSKFDSFKPPYSDKDILILSECAAAIKYPEPEPGQPKKDYRKSKYCSKSKLRFIFNLNGIVQFYAYYPGHRKLKKPLLGNNKTMTVAEAATLSAIIFDNQMYGQTLGEVAEKFIESLSMKHENDKRVISKKTIKTYSSQINAFVNVIGSSAKFLDISQEEIKSAFDKLYEEKKANYTYDVSNRVKSLFAFASEKLNLKNKSINEIRTNYIPAPIKSTFNGYTDGEGISKLMYRLEEEPNTQKKNAVLLMAFTAVRPVNIIELKTSYLDNLKNPKYITYPKSTMTKEGAMKNKGQFKIKLTLQMTKIIKNQLSLHPDKPNEYLFFSFKDCAKAMPYNSLREYFMLICPNDIYKSSLEDLYVKGTAGPCFTLLRQHAKTNVVRYLVKEEGYSLSNAQIESKLILGHTGREHDRSGEHYDKNDELYDLRAETAYKYFLINEAIILQGLDAFKKGKRIIEPELPIKLPEHLIPFTQKECTTLRI
ncbi:hypothetical protein AN394_02330 [Pseudoalteromonas sp. P1-26]|uniref:hypothetical protein n=1 Tax=Pseudoalteromonas sp. P1-26 TaxID=1723759 RepID=UPI0006D68FA9|nr:hypothetical protein [Pseudoalteromonas sp. P1-26]KPZ70561.1 hypothetical protein AN394_02330 [Pseudoalteromonas sp. P1-26]